MKKTLAAVLAAAMALSTATVALARDTLVDEDRTADTTVDVEEKIRYGKDIKRIINELGDFNATELAEEVENGNITVSAIVTEGSKSLSGKPAITVRRDASTVTQTNSTPAYYWTKNITVNGKVVCRKGTKVGDLPVYRQPGDAGWEGDVDGDNDVALEWMDSSHPDYIAIRNWLVTDGQIESRTGLKDNSEKGDKVLRLLFKVTDTYGTGSTVIGMKLRITVRKDFVGVNGISYKKGDTYTSEEFKFKAEYNELDQYNEDMQLTLQEVDDRNVKLDASDLYDQIGADDFSITFEDSARFDAKLSASQKDVNLFYDVDEVSAVTDAYPSVDFEFITFRGNPSFINSGTMTFNAVGGRNTQVYTYDGDALTPLDGTYDSTYGTVTVKGIKKLGTFVVASEILEVEEEPEEPAEPVDSAPSVEDKNDEEGGNPNTGAC